MPRWLLLAFTIAVVVAIGHEVLTDTNRAEPTFYESLRADQLADKEAAAVILARAHAQEVFAAQGCSANVCEDPAARAVVKAAHDTLINGGCIDWEMSEWDPSRGLAKRAAPKSRAEAEAECLAQANAISDRLIDSVAVRRQSSSTDN